MDTALSFLPLTLTSIPLTTARAASSMDFSLRFFTPLPADKPMNETWLLHEQNTERAADGRSFSIGRMFDTAGVEIARMSQVSILRGPPDSPGASGVKESKTVSSAGPLDRAAKL
jgi:acyl-CoA thioesterase